MVYVFDSGPLIVMFNYYYPKRFLTLWNNFNEMLVKDQIISVREVKNELLRHEDSLSEWVKEHSEVFHISTNVESEFVQRIFQINHFRTLISKQAQLEGNPVADPFVIAKAFSFGEEGCVVTTEIEKPNAAKIPNVCRHFGIRCCGLEEFMEEEGWSF